MDFTNKFAWVWKRYQLGYSFFGSALALFNFAGIFTLLFQNILPNYIILP